MLNAIQTLYRNFSVPRRLIQRRDEVQPPTATRGRLEWILARSLCHYRYFSLQGIPLQHRHNTLMQHIRQWSPFADYDSYIVWRKNAALVWVWNRATQQKAQAEQEITTPIKCLPETVLLSQGNDGGQLCQCIEGVEGQLWQQHQLIASRWWPQTPNLSQWNNFLRAHNLAAVATLPPEQPHQLSPHPWAKAAKMDRSALLRDERLWVFAGLSMFAILLSWQGVYVWKLQQAIATVEAKTAAISEDAVPILSARNEVLALQQKVERLQNVAIYPQQLEMMAKTANHIPHGATLRAWSYQKGRLQLTLQAKQIDVRHYVTKFQEQPLFFDVRAETGNDNEQIVMTMQVRPAAELD